MQQQDQAIQQLCKQFFDEFDILLPRVTNPDGRYENSIQYAFNRIEKLDHVKRVNNFPTKKDEFLVLDEGQMAVYTRIVREKCNFLNIRRFIGAPILNVFIYLLHSTRTRNLATIFS